MSLLNFKIVNKIYFLAILLLYTNLLSIQNANAISFVVNDLEIEKKYDSTFSREKVYDLAFKKAFKEIMLKIVLTSDQNKIQKTSLITIKSLIDNFNIYDEKFIENNYSAKIDVNFNKRDTLLYLEKKNIFPSIPKKIDIFFLPIIVDSKKDDLLLFNINPLHKEWNKLKKNHHLIKYILPQEDIDYIKILKKELDNIESFNFDSFAKQYDLQNYVISIIFIDQNETRILSKLYINSKLKILNRKIDDFNFEEVKSLLNLIQLLKNDYEDYWKILNQINTSIKLPITLITKSSNMNKAFKIERKLKDIDLISKINIESYDNEKIIFKIIFNGSPKQFINAVNEKNINIEKEDNFWIVK